MINATIVNTEAIDALIGQLHALESIDFMPLMVEWGTILTEDNREGALAGLDGFGYQLTAVTYRPDPNVGTRRKGGIDYEIKLNNNLSGTHYRSLDGPPLAPRGENSRVVTNFVTHPDGPLPDGQWHTLGGWAKVLNINGDFQILTAHFPGPDHNPKLPVRDLAHVRPTALAKAREALTRFVKSLLGKP